MEGWLSMNFLKRKEEPCTWSWRSSRPYVRNDWRGNERSSSPRSETVPFWWEALLAGRFTKVPPLWRNCPTWKALSRSTARGSTWTRISVQYSNITALAWTEVSKFRGNSAAWQMHGFITQLSQLKIIIQCLITRSRELHYKASQYLLCGGLKSKQCNRGQQNLVLNAK
jgi:hypothetical protein